MGNAASFDYGLKYSLFAHPKIIETYNKFIVEPSAIESFTKFIKSGLWLDKISHNNSKIVIFDEILVNQKKNKEQKLANTILKNAINLNKEVTSPFCSNQSTAGSTISINTIQSSTNSSYDDLKLLHDCPSQKFKDYYYVGAEGDGNFNMQQLLIVMIVTLFPFYFISEEYQTWFMWKKTHSENIPYNKFKIKEQYNDNLNDNDTRFHEHVLDPSNMKAQAILLGTAAYFDEYFLLKSLNEKPIFNDLYNTLDSCKYGITICDAQARKCGFPILFSNKAIENMTGYNLFGYDYDVLNGEDTESYQVKSLKNSLISMQPIQISMINYHKNCTPFLHMYITKPVFDAHGNYIYIACIHYNIIGKGMNQIDIESAQDLLSLIPLLLQHSACFNEVSNIKQNILIEQQQKLFLSKP